MDSLDNNKAEVIRKETHNEKKQSGEPHHSDHHNRYHFYHNDRSSYNKKRRRNVDSKLVAALLFAIVMIVLICCEAVSSQKLEVISQKNAELQELVNMLTKNVGNIDNHELEGAVNQLSRDVENIKNGVSTTTKSIKDWDAPIYDAHIPVFELSEEKEAMTKAEMTPDHIYSLYDALMAKHPNYITKTDLGLCSDGINHVYRYDFREPEPLHEDNKVWSETKAKAIIVTGIHYEWAGIYALYNAMEEIADNSELCDLRRNTHLIVVPVANPYATIVSNYKKSIGVLNANGVEIHRNFEVDFKYPNDPGYVAPGEAHHGGIVPLSEVETQYIDNIMKENTDAAFFLSCHNAGTDSYWGTGFIWASTATKYMCNMGYRLIDKMSAAWMNKYGDILLRGIEEYKTDRYKDGETRLGYAGLSTSPGTEAKQATKYGIQGTNVEIRGTFQIHGTKANPEPTLSSFTMSRGTEVYVNFLLTAFGVYDQNDKVFYYSE